MSWLRFRSSSMEYFINIITATEERQLATPAMSQGWSPTSDHNSSTTVQLEQGDGTKRILSRQFLDSKDFKMNYNYIFIIFLLFPGVCSGSLGNMICHTSAKPLMPIWMSMCIHRKTHEKRTSFVSPCCRYPSIQVWAMWESFHTEMLSGVPYEEDSWHPPTVCIPPETFQDLCVWRLWLHLKPPWWVLPPCETVPPW